MNSKPEYESPEGSDEAIGAALKVSLIVIACLMLIAGGIVAAWTLFQEEPVVAETAMELPEVRDVASVALPQVGFQDITEAAGIDFVHFTGATGEKLLPETMGGGCAFFDYDGDGDQDLLLINGARWPWDAGDSQDAPHSVLYANDGDGNFSDVSTETGIDQIKLYGMGAAVGDYDNDGDVDLYVTAVGANRLYRNDQGVFTDVTQEAGASGGDQWSTSAAWFDYNRDGRLDLFVCNYVAWSRELDTKQAFRLDGVGRAYGPPTAFDGDFPTLLRNDGDGRFTDVSESAGVQKRNTLTDKPAGKSMGVAPVDFNGDGWMDLIVANDTVDNFVFENQRDGTFREVGLEVGVAVGDDGKPRGAMGIDTARHRNSDSLAVAIGNFSNEMTSLFVTAPAGDIFEDIATSSGLGPQTRLELTFGLCFLDIDLDGRLDLMCANGHLEEEINKVLSSQHYEQPPQLFWNNGTGRGSEFVPLKSEHIGEDFKRPMVGRGAAFADIDGDGDLDLLFTSSGGRPRLLRNDLQTTHRWLRVKLQGSGQPTGVNRDAIGAWVRITVNGRTLHRQVMPSRSYLSQTELPVTFGLGELPADATVDIDVDWGNGQRQTAKNVATNAEVTVQQQLAEGPTPTGGE